MKLSAKFVSMTASATAFAISCSIFLSPAIAQEPAAQGSSSENQLVAIENVSNDILKTEIQLMKHSASFHAAWLKPNRWKSWRVFAYKIAASGLTNAGMITIASSRFRYLDDPSKAPRPFLKAGHIVNLTAASILVGGTLTEALLDRVSEMRIAKRHQDPKSALNEFLRLRNSLDALLAARKDLVVKNDSLSQCQRELIDADGLVLQDLRELVSAEFAHSYCEVAQLRGVRDASNAAAFLSSAAAGYMGSLQSLLAVADRHPHQTGVAGLGFITAGSGVAATPLLVKLGGAVAKRRAVSKLNQRGVSTDLPEDQLELHRAKFEQVVSAAPPSEKSLLAALDARSTIYRLHNEMLDARDHDRAALKRRTRRDLAERLFFSTIVGGSNIARGTQLVVAGFHYADVPTTNFKLVASASTVFIAGSGVWTADNIQGKVREELLERKIKAGKLSVHGKLLQNLEDLEEMEDQISVY